MLNRYAVNEEATPTVEQVSRDRRISNCMFQRVNKEYPGFVANTRLSSPDAYEKNLYVSNVGAGKF